MNFAPHYHYLTAPLQQQQQKRKPQKQQKIRHGAVTCVPKDPFSCNKKDEPDFTSSRALMETFTTIDLNDPCDKYYPVFDTPVLMETLSVETEEKNVEKVPSSCMISNGLRSSRVGIAWKDLWVSVLRSRNQSTAVLHGLSGYAEAGHILAIMGPSGSGKSTLLDALSGRLGKNARLSGEICSSTGSGKRNMSHGKGIAYVTQEDTLLGTLTVRETIMYSARLRLPESVGKEEREALVEEAMDEMGLSESAHTPVGNWHLRGLSGGEKRRLSIALEILTRPKLLFLDEPTSGLDSASAFFVTATLRRLAHEGERTLIAAIHQPGSETFDLFDSLFLLSGGRTVYFGDREMASEHFANAGFPCPRDRNPSDHYLCSINSDFDKVKSSFPMELDSETALYPLDKSITSSQMTNILVDTYRNSKSFQIARARAEEFITQQFQKADGINLNVIPNTSFLTQTRVLSARSFVNMRRDVGYYWLRLVIYIMLTTCIGSIYFNIGTTYQSLMARGACISYVTGFLTFMSIGGFPSFIEDMKVFSREQLNGHYRVISFVVANLLSALPFLGLIAIVSSSICYYMVGLHPGVSHFVYFVLCLLTCLAVVESLMMAVASVIPNFLMGIITGAGIQGIFMLVAGFFRLPNDMPKPIWRYPMSYLSFHTYAMQGMYKNDFLGLTFMSGDERLAPPIAGKVILANMYEMDLGRSKWWDLVALLAMVVAYRIIFLLIIKSTRAYCQWRQHIGLRLGAKSPSSPSSCSASSFSFSS